MPRSNDPANPYISLQMEELVDAYFLNKGDKKAAMVAAGYSTEYDSYGYRLFATNGVKKLIEDRKKQLREKFEASFENIVAELGEIVRGYKRLAKYKKVDDKGSPYWDFTGATEEDLAFITSMDVEVTFEENEEEGGAPVQVRKVKISGADLKDAKAALDSLSKIVGLDKNRVEISGPDGKPIEIDDKELARKLAFILTKGAQAPDKQES